MEDQEVQSLPVFAVTAAVGAVVLLFILLCNIGRTSDSKKEEDEKGDDKVANGHKPVQQKTAQKKKERLPVKRKDTKASFSHAWLATTLKSHGASVLGMGFSPNGKYLATCAEDRTILLWSTKQFTQKEHKCIRANVELDFATKVQFSPDSKALIGSLSRENTVRFFRITKKDDGSSVTVQATQDFPTKCEHEIMNIGVASSGRFIMTCYAEPFISIWDIKGELLATVTTNQMSCYYGATSPCGRFVASSGFTPDVKVWEVVFDKSGNFREVMRAFELKGHTAGVYSFSFSEGSTRMATVSKDGTWKVWDTSIEYQKQQDPKLLLTGNYEHSGNALIAIAPDGRTVAIATGADITLYSALTGEVENHFQDVHSRSVTCLQFDQSSKFLLSSGDKHIQVFHNVPGYKVTIEDLEQKLKKATNKSHKDRLKEQIVEAKKCLAEFEASS